MARAIISPRPREWITRHAHRKADARHARARETSRKPRPSAPGAVVAPGPARGRAPGSQSRRSDRDRGEGHAILGLQYDILFIRVLSHFSLFGGEKKTHETTRYVRGEACADPQGQGSAEAAADQGIDRHRNALLVARVSLPLCGRFLLPPVRRSLAGLVSFAATPNPIGPCGEGARGWAAGGGVCVWWPGCVALCGTLQPLLGRPLCRFCISCCPSAARGILRGRGRLRHDGRQLRPAAVFHQT